MIKKLLKKSKFIMNIHYKMKYGKRLNNKFTFIDRANGSEKLCYIIAGYKDFLWDNIFSRIKSFVPNDVDVCILSSGLYSEKLDEIAKENNWSYLYTKYNNVSLSQNIVINAFKQAKYIFKLDEDIFVTKNYFENLFDCYTKVKENSLYEPGFVAPIIPINGFGNVEVLKKYNLLDVYTKKFESPKYQAGSKRMIENNPEVAKFMWGADDCLPSIDKMAEDFNKDKFDYVACPIRFSIGAILFEKKLWKDMEYFEVSSKKSVDLGLDEGQICSYCIRKSLPIIVSKNCLVGHLSFGPQNKTMKEYYLQNKSKFEI